MNHKNLNISDADTHKSSKRLAQAALIFALLMSPAMQDEQIN